MNVHAINHDHLEIDRVVEIVDKGIKLTLSEEAVEAIEKGRSYLDDKMERAEAPIYGINTGFGSLCNTTVSTDQLGQLQVNLVMSHACGMGEEVPEQIVKYMLLLKIQGLSYGHSGVQLATVQRLIDLFNEDVLPVVYQQGSLGASGDLAPLAHLSLPLLGEGEVNYKGHRRSAKEVMELFDWKPIRLQSKEGLALLNGTQFMSAYGLYNIDRATRLSAMCDLVGALSLDAYDGRIEPFSDAPHIVRKQPGQLVTARAVRKALEGSEIIARNKAHVQDPYSFRCMPQVHGASKDVINFVRGVITNEINSVTDNPTVFPELDEVISAGNFHGQPLALAMDQLAIAVAELGSISERRTYKLISGTRDLPAFLIAEPGLDSGFMIPQYSQASIVSQNKQYCTPASVDTIDSSNGQEDHVSMGANAATKCKKVVDNLSSILGIELLNAAQAIEFRRPLKSSEVIESLISDFRSVCGFVAKDDEVPMYERMHSARRFVESKL